MARTDRVAPGTTDTVVPSAARTASGDSGPTYGWGAASTLRAQLDATAVSASSTLDVVIEDTLDGTNWHVVGTFAQKGAVGVEVINVTSPFTDRLRVRWTLGGAAPSITFSVSIYSE